MTYHISPLISKVLCPGAHFTLFFLALVIIMSSFGPVLIRDQALTWELVLKWGNTYPFLTRTGMFTLHLYT